MTTATAPTQSIYAALTEAQTAIGRLERERAGLAAAYEKATRQADAPEMSRIKRRQGDIGEEITAAKIVAAKAEIVIAEAEAQDAAAEPILGEAASKIPELNAAIEAARTGLDQALVARRNYGFTFESAQSNLQNKRGA